jgi:hypothetical protein
LMKTIDRESYYIPWLRFVVDERKAMYRALVEF